MAMLLVIDIGNTNIVLGLYSGNSLAASWRLGTDVRKTVDEYELFLHSLFSLHGMDTKAVSGAIIASVVPPANGLFEVLVLKMFGIKPLVVGAGIKTGMTIKMDNPREVGADRIANAVAAYELYGGPVIVADFGTATTFDVVSAEGQYIGGMISPGINIAMEALFQKAAKLPRVALSKPSTAIGKNTVSCMQSGTIHYVVGGINYSVQAIWKELGSHAKVVATGGLAELIGPQAEIVDVVNRDLTLEGLRIIYYRNQ